MEQLSETVNVEELEEIAWRGMTETLSRGELHT
jgi:hypothetical protein